MIYGNYLNIQMIKNGFYCGITFNLSVAHTMFLKPSIKWSKRTNDATDINKVWFRTIKSVRSWNFVQREYKSKFQWTDFIGTWNHFYHKKSIMNLKKLVFLSQTISFVLIAFSILIETVTKIIVTLSANGWEKW